MKRAIATISFAALALTLGATLPSHAQTKLDMNNIVGTLQTDDTTSVGQRITALRKQAEENIRNRRGDDPATREPLSEELNKLAQLTVAVQFDFNSARIRPASYRTIGLIADSLYHPYLLGHRFMVVGHTDAKGGREYNLKLSQQRADAIVEALVNPFGINPARLQAVGLGEEQLLDRSNPLAAENRRVQVINIGPVR